MEDFLVSKSVSTHKSARDSATRLFEHPESQPTSAVAAEPPVSAFSANLTNTTPSDAIDI